VYLVDNNPLFFPHPYAVNDYGVVGLGGNTDPHTLLMAYQAGIFPWSNPNEPLLWWYTHPRLILYPQNIAISKSMIQVLKSGQFRCSMNQAFTQVIDHCQSIPRDGQEGTWLSDSLKQSFIALHKRGFAHSLEVWEGEELVGGLYGLGIGKIFCGESMFALRPNASKAGLIYLSGLLQRYDFTCIDCQQETPHLQSMGADTIGPGAFLELIRLNAFEKWTYLADCLSS
jgi:leucyl/phenylalanyl-tRNA---protein transferase